MTPPLTDYDRPEQEIQSKPAPLPCPECKTQFEPFRCRVCQRQVAKECRLCHFPKRHAMRAMAAEK